MLILNAYGVWRDKKYYNANLMHIKIKHSVFNCITPLNKQKSEPVQYISICFQKEQMFSNLDSTDLVEHDVIDMLTFFVVWCYVKRLKVN